MSLSNIMNPFQLLGIEPSFVIDQSAIERAYRLKLSHSHPDAVGGSIDQQDPQDHPVDPATLNEARAMLINSELRANALLELLGGPSASESKDLPDGFLMEMMIKREEIEEEIQSADSDSRERWEDWAFDQRTQYEDESGRLFESLNELEDHERANQLRAIRTHLNAWRYIERLIEQLDPGYDPSKADF